MDDVPLPKVDYDAGWHRQYTADQMHTHAAAVTAAKDARIKVLEDALRMALAELDELPVWSNTGHVCNIARAALGDKTPTTPLPSPSPRS